MKKQDYFDCLRHSCAHLLAAAVMKLYPKAKRTIGPAIENGFYFDFDFGDLKISEDDLPKIEEKMREIVNTWKGFDRHELTKDQAKDEFPDNPYKHELIEEFSEKGEKLTFYKSGDYWDLCRGGHIDMPSEELKYFKLLSVAGAYWRGSEKNKMLTRIYGTCFGKKTELDNYLQLLQEIKKRDHRKLGKSLDLFVIDENIGKGLPLLTPKGTLIKKLILDYEYELEIAAGFQHVSTPHIARSQLYKKTGHWQHYQDVMFAPFGIEGEEYVLKPMNCPHHYMIYQSKPRSYRDLPIRFSEPGTCYRYEKTGELSGLLRVRALTIDDAHILMREDQIEAEFKLCIEMVEKMFKAFKLPNYYVRLSLSDPSDSVKFIADQSTWKKAGQLLEKIVRKNNLKYKIAKGEASFYGPKLDYIVKDSLGRQWQMSTLQLDLFMGKRLGLTYIDENGKEQYPVILHRGLTGSIERTLAILIEHFSGAFPLWLSPLQIMLVPIAERHNEYAKILQKKFQEHKIRCEVDSRNERMQLKIREATLQKIPYISIIGDRETKSQSQISVREQGKGDLGVKNIDDFISEIKASVSSKR